MSSPRSRPQLLVTNDDGIHSPFLAPLVHALLEVADVLVCAPAEEQSWISKAMSRHRPVRAEASPLFPCPAFAFTGTPSDCVNIGLAFHAPRPVDAVVSGINLGYNAGLPFVCGSGTVGGALEGAFHGLPAFAFSQDLARDDLEAVRHGGLGRARPALAGTLRASARHAARLTLRHLGDHERTVSVVHNYNFPSPCDAETPVATTVPELCLLPKLFREESPGTFVFDFHSGRTVETPGCTDRAALAAHQISYTRLDYAALGRQAAGLPSRAP